MHNASVSRKCIRAGTDGGTEYRSFYQEPAADRVSAQVVRGYDRVDPRSWKPFVENGFAGAKYLSIGQECSLHRRWTGRVGDLIGAEARTGQSARLQVSRGDDVHGRHGKLIDQRRMTPW